MALSFAEIKDRGLGIYREEIEQGALESLVGEGLEVIALCNYSTGRSKGAAEILTCTKHPTVYLEGGLSGLSTADRIQVTIVADKLRQVPHVVVFLTDPEKSDYAALLSKIGKVEYHANPVSVFQRLTNRF
jgi:hypothetical protein